MKKYIIAIVVALSILIIPNVKAIEKPEVTDHEKVKIYLFYADWCGNCHNFINYFLKNADNYSDYFEIVAYMVSYDPENKSTTWKNENNAWVTANNALALKLKEHFEIADDKFGWPFIIIGDYQQAGFGTGEKIVEEALKQYQNKKYKDVVAENIGELKDSVKVNTLEEAAKNCELIKETVKKNDALAIGIIFGAIVVVFGGLVLISRKKN